MISTIAGPKVPTVGSTRRQAQNGLGSKAGAARTKLMPVKFGVGAQEVVVGAAALLGGGVLWALGTLAWNMVRVQKQRDLEEAQFRKAYQKISTEDTAARLDKLREAKESDNWQLRLLSLTEIEKLPVMPETIIRRAEELRYDWAPIVQEHAQKVLKRLKP